MNHPPLQYSSSIFHLKAHMTLLSVTAPLGNVAHISQLCMAKNQCWCQTLGLQCQRSKANHHLILHFLLSWPQVAVLFTVTSILLDHSHLPMDTSVSSPVFTNSPVGCWMDITADTVSQMFVTCLVSFWRAIYHYYIQRPTISQL